MFILEGYVALWAALLVLSAFIAMYDDIAFSVTLEELREEEAKTRGIVAGERGGKFRQPGQTATSIGLILALISAFLILIIEAHFWLSIFVVAVLGASSVIDFVKTKIMKKSSFDELPEWYFKIMFFLYLAVVVIMIILILS